MSNINYMGLQVAVAKVLKEEFPQYKVYNEEVKQDAKFPCFFIQILPENTINESVYYTQKNALINIVYYDNYDRDLQSRIHGFMIAEMLEDLFGRVLPVGERNVLIPSYSTNIEERDVNLFFSIMWYNNNMSLQKELSKLETMKEFYIDFQEAKLKNKYNK